MSIVNSVRGRIFIVVCHGVQYLVHSSLIFSLMTLSASCLLAICVTTLMIILYTLIAETSTKFKNIWKKDFEILENWFYDGYMALDSRKYEFMGFAKTSESEVFTYHEVQIKKATTKKLHGITIDEHLNFKEHIEKYMQECYQKAKCIIRSVFSSYLSSFLSSYLDVSFYQVLQKNQ